MSVAQKRRKINTVGIMTDDEDCPGLNVVVRAVTKMAINRYGLPVLSIYYGFLRVIEKWIELLRLEDVSNILTRGRTIMEKSNKANSPSFPVTGNGKTTLRDVRENCVHHVREMGLDSIMTIDGDATMDEASNLTASNII